MTVLEAAQSAVVEYLTKGGPLLCDETAESLARHTAFRAGAYMSMKRRPQNNTSLVSRTLQIMRKANSI